MQRCSERKKKGKIENGFGTSRYEENDVTEVGVDEKDGDTLGGTDLDRVSLNEVKDVGILAKTLWLLLKPTHNQGLAQANCASSVFERRDRCSHARNGERWE